MEVYVVGHEYVALICSIPGNYNSTLCIIYHISYISRSIDPVVYTFGHRTICVPLLAVERRDQNVGRMFFDFGNSLLQALLFIGCDVWKVANHFFLFHTWFWFFAITIDAELQVWILEITTIDTDNTTIMLVSFNGLHPVECRLLCGEQCHLALCPSVIAPVGTSFECIVYFFLRRQTSVVSLANGRSIFVSVNVVADIKDFFIVRRYRIGCRTFENGFRFRCFFLGDIHLRIIRII